MLDPEWVRLADYLQSEWDEVLTELIELVTPEDEEEEVTESHSAETQPGDPVLNVSALSKLAQKWLTETTNSVENSDAGILDHVRFYQICWHPSSLFDDLFIIVENPKSSSLGAFCSQQVGCRGCPVFFILYPFLWLRHGSFLFRSGSTSMLACLFLFCM